MANVLIITGSARKKSNSNALAEQVAQGARTAGHEVTVLDIAHMDIRSCKGCEACHQPKSKGCVQKDDMQNCYPLLQNADVLLFASPIYWFTLCGQIKQFIDRCYAVALPMNGTPGILQGRKIGGIFAFGGDDAFDSGCVNAIRTLQDICFYAGATWLGALYGSCQEPDEAANNEQLMQQAREYGAAL